MSGIDGDEGGDAPPSSPLPAPMLPSPQSPKLRDVANKLPKTPCMDKLVSACHRLQERRCSDSIAPSPPKRVCFTEHSSWEDRADHEEFMESMLQIRAAARACDSEMTTFHNEMSAVRRIRPP